MGRRVLVVAPHPDDETLGCGGTLLRHVAEGDETYWLIITAMNPEQGFSSDRIESRASEIKEVSQQYRFNSVHQLGLPTTRLDTLALGDVVAAVGAVMAELQPETLYLPFRADAHSDHRIVYDGCIAHAKWFRTPSLREVHIYETPSETDFQSDLGMQPFHPNLYVDIAPYLEKKMEIMAMYKGESGEFPFPRSREALEALARKRGAESGYLAAEGFMIFKQRH